MVKNQVEALMEEVADEHGYRPAFGMILHSTCSSMK
jgi:hypothetical protein